MKEKSKNLQWWKGTDGNQHVKLPEGFTWTEEDLCAFAMQLRTACESISDKPKDWVYQAFGYGPEEC